MSDEQHPDPERWWKHRRRGFYTGIWWALLQTPVWGLIAFYNAPVLQSLDVVIGSSYGVSMVLIISYYGNNAAEAFASRSGR